MGAGDELTIEPALVVTRSLSRRQVAARRRLLDAARELAREGGYEAVGMRAVSERAGVSAPTAYQYFSSRDHVLVELLIELNATTNNAVATRPSRRRDPVERAVATLRRVVRAVEDDPKLFVAMMRAYISGAPDIRHASGAMQSSMRLWIDSALGDTEVDDRDEIVAIIGSVWFAAVVGLVSGWRAPSEVGDDLERAVRMLLKGIEDR
jgi:AcrR family transcriptional regulator